MMDTAAVATPLASGNGKFTTQELRRMLSKWTTGVCVVTSVTRTGYPVGKAVNSFHSVSMTPPLVGWCVDAGSTYYNDWVSAPGYVVHVLGEHQADLVRRFAQKGGDKFGGLDWTPGPGGLPLIDDVPLQIVCTTRQTLVAGDHTYLIGEVDQLTDLNHQPLVFHGGKARTLQQLFDEQLAGSVAPGDKDNS